MLKYNILLLAVLLLLCRDHSPTVFPGEATNYQANLTINPAGPANPQADTISHPPCSEFEIPHYTAYRIKTRPEIDGQLDEPFWRDAPKSLPFRDLISGTETIHDTRVAVLWDDECLYVAYWVEEPNVEATLTERDAKIYQDNDVELFIAGRDTYYEFEINAFGTIYEVFFIWEESYKKGGYDTIAGLSPDEPGRIPFHGVGYKPHPRGPRIGYWNWDFPGLQSAVFVDGTINENQDRDRGWTVELALPWSGMSVLAMADNRSLPPQVQDIWRMDFSRFNQYREAPPTKDSKGWAWSPHGVMDSHVPDCYTYIHFSTEVVGNNSTIFQ